MRWNGLPLAVVRAGPGHSGSLQHVLALIQPALSALLPLQRKIITAGLAAASTLTGMAATSLGWQLRSRSCKERREAKARAETAAALEYSEKGMENVENGVAGLKAVIEKEMGSLRGDLQKLTKRLTRASMQQELLFSGHGSIPGSSGGKGSSR